MMNGTLPSQKLLELCQVLESIVINFFNVIELQVELLQLFKLDFAKDSIEQATASKTIKLGNFVDRFSAKKRDFWLM